MATAVQIELMVDEKGAVSGVQKFDSALKGTSAQVRQLNRQLSELPAAGSMKSLEREFTAGESSLRTMNAEVRSLSGSLFGDTRAASEFLATLPKVAEAMELAFPLFGAVALVGVLLDAGEKIHDLYDKYLSLTAAAEDYQKTLDKAKDEDFGNVHSIETAKDRIDEATSSVQAYNRAVHGLVSGGIWSQVAGFISNPEQALTERVVAHKMAGEAVHSKQQVDKITPKMVEMQHEQAVQQIEYNHALDGSLKGVRKVNAELAKQRELNAEARKYNNELDTAHGNPVAKDAGASKERLKDQTAQREAQAERINLAREQEAEIRQLHNAAIDANLQGDALYKAQEEQAIEQLKEKQMASAAAVDAVHLKFHNLAMKRLADEQLATAKIERQAAMTGMTGIAKSQAESANRIADLNADKNLDPAERQKRIVASNVEAHAEIVQQQHSFADQVDQIAGQSADHQVAGFARIRQQASKELDDLQRKFDATYGHMDRSTPGGAAEYATGLSDLHRGQSAVHASALDARAELARTNAAQTRQIEEQAWVKSLDGEKAKTAAIEVEYETRLEKYREQLSKQEISQQDYNRRVVAAQQERDGEMEAEAKAAREKMASDLSSLFHDPVQALAKMGEKVAGEAGAGLVQRVQQRYGGHGAAHAGSIFGGIFGGGKHPADQAEMHGASAHAASSAFSVGTATISIGSASLVGLGAGGGGGFTGGGGGGFSGGGFASLPAFGGGSGAGSGGGSGPGGILGNLQQGVGLGKSMRGLFAKSNSTLLQPNDAEPANLPGVDGKPLGSGFGKSLMGGGGLLANAGGAFGGALGVFSAARSGGGFGGALSGAMGGMQFGMALGGPVGAALGAAVGGILGAFGSSSKAHYYDETQVRPRIKNDLQAYQTGGDYLSAYSDIQALMTEAKHTTNKMGSAGKSYYQSTIKKEISDAEERLTREQKAGRSHFTFSAAMYDVGTDYVPRTGMAVIHEGERIMPSDHNERITRAIESGAISDSYRQAMSGRSTRQPVAGGDRTLNMHVYAHDTKSVQQFFHANKHHMRAALNASYAENSGGSDA